MNRKWVRWIFGLTLLLSWRPCPGASGQSPEDKTKRLTVRLGRPSEAAGEFRLLPEPQEMTDGDGFVLYTRAAEMLPKDLDWAKIKAWRQAPGKELPLEDVRSMLRRSEAGLKLLEQAGRCKQCDWPYEFEDDCPFDLPACRNIAFLLALEARFQLAEGDYSSCVRTLRTGFALARHLGDGPSVLHVLVGAATSAVLCGEIELYAQQPGAPSLEAALRAIPHPLVYEEPSELYGMDAAGRNRTQLALRRANRHLIAVQYIEALRRHAVQTAAWPQTLAELKANLPDDPVAGKPFVYERLSETRAILSGLLPEGGGPKDIVRYELNLVK